MADCKPCNPGPEYLFGPGRKEPISGTFEVRDKPVVLRACGLPDDACLQIRQQFTACGESHDCAAVDLNGCEVSVCATSPVALVMIPGRYFATLEGADPEDVTLTWAELPSGITYTVQGGGGMSCGPQLIVNSTEDSLTIVYDGVIHTLNLGDYLTADALAAALEPYLTAVISDATLTGDGTAAAPLGVAPGAFVTPAQLAAALAPYLQSVVSSAPMSGAGTAASPLTIDLSGYVTQAAHDATLVPVFGNDSATVLFNVHAA